MPQIEKPWFAAHFDLPEAENLRACYIHVNKQSHSIAADMGKYGSNSEKCDNSNMLIPRQPAKPCDTVLFLMLPLPTFF